MLATGWNCRVVINVSHCRKKQFAERRHERLHCYIQDSTPVVGLRDGWCQQQSSSRGVKWNCRAGPSFLGCEMELALVIESKYMGGRGGVPCPDSIPPNPSMPISHMHVLVPVIFTIQKWVLICLSIVRKRY